MAISILSYKTHEILFLGLLCHASGVISRLYTSLKTLSIDFSAYLANAMRARMVDGEGAVQPFEHTECFKNKFAYLSSLPSL